jgi:hypothetical protein
LPLLQKRQLYPIATTELQRYFDQLKSLSRYAHLGDETLRRVSDNITHKIADAIA